MNRALVVLLLLAPAPVFAHGKSKSFAEWSFRSHGAELRINFAGHDLAASVPGIDSDLDGRLSVPELSANLALIARRTVEHTTLSIADGGAQEDCRAGKTEVRGLGEPVISEVQVRAEWICDARIERARVASRQLPELEPPHVTVATFLAGKTIAQHVFSVAAPSYELDVELPTLAEELGGTALAGVRSLFTPAALLFLLGLLLFERPKQASLLFAIHLFALHAAGLAFPLSPPPSWYPIVFAAAVAWCGLELMARRGARMPLRKPIVGALLSASFGAVLAPQVDLPNRLAFAVGETAAALVSFAACVVLAILLGSRSDQYRRPVGIAWSCGAGALMALAFVG